MSERPITAGIIISGGPAPGTNGVISSITIEAINRGWRVLGFREGFEHLCKGVTTEIEELTIPRVSRLHLQGGSVLGTSRVSPADSERRAKNTARTLRQLEVDVVFTVGGDDVLRGADHLSQAAGEDLQVIHIPKTIDNDLRLPSDVVTLGHETARAEGVGLIANILEDSHTTTRWYFVACMGRLAGFLTLGIGKAAGATLTVIPEEFPVKPISLQQICDRIEGCMIVRAAMGRPRGVVLLAEGLAGHFSPEEAEELKNVERDKEGNLRLGEIDLARKVKAEILNRFQARKQKVTIVDKNMGYELRCVPPCPFDSEYARDLGFAAVKQAAQGVTREMICLEGGTLRPLSFDECIDPGTGRGYRRDVDPESTRTRVARAYQARLEPDNLEDEDFLRRAEETCGVDKEYLAGLLR